MPLLVSEFAPGGMSPADRPEGFRSMWKMIRGANGWVLGGAVYAWTTDGPGGGRPRLRAGRRRRQPGRRRLRHRRVVLSRRRAADRRRAASQPGQGRDERVWSFARQAIAAIQAGKSAQLLPATADTSIMGDVNAVAQTPSAEAEMIVQRVRDPRRVAWARDAGVVGEWWVTWLPALDSAPQADVRRPGAPGRRAGRRLHLPRAALMTEMSPNQPTMGHVSATVPDPLPYRGPGETRNVNRGARAPLSRARGRGWG